MKKHRPNILLSLTFLIGLSLLLYPSVSDYWNSLHQSRAIATYAETVTQLDENLYQGLWEVARAYNRSLPGKANRLMPTEEELAVYYSLLDVAGNGILGYIEIPDIKCSLPVYHGVDPAVLQIAVGHIEGTSLPTGGESTHCVLSGHRGLPSAKLFTDLDQMAKGDLFMLRVLDETLTYEVDQILIVEPHEVDALEIIEGEDLCTLVTCTPYGVNSHRLLVRGHRIENLEIAKTVHVTADALQIEPILVAPVVAAPILLALLVAMLISTRKKKS